MSRECYIYKCIDIVKEINVFISSGNIYRLEFVKILHPELSASLLKIIPGAER